jgi:hypothetical protein
VKKGKEVRGGAEKLPRRVGKSRKELGVVGAGKLKLVLQLNGFRHYPAAQAGLQGHAFGKASGLGQFTVHQAVGLAQQPAEAQAAPPGWSCFGYGYHGRSRGGAGTAAPNLYLDNLGLSGRGGRGRSYGQDRRIGIGSGGR